MGADFASPWVLLLLPIVVAGTVWLWRDLAATLGRTRRWVVLGIRLLLLLLLLLAMAGLTWQQPETGEAVVFVGDLSSSVAATQPQLEAWIRAATGTQSRPANKAGIVAVGRDALVEQSVSSGQLDFNHFQSIVDPSYTNLAEGLNLAAALLPATLRRRVVLLSDGQQNLGDALAEARILHSEGTRLDVVPFGGSHGPEVLVKSLTIPATLHAGEHATAAVDVESTVATPALLQLFADGRLIAGGNVAIQPGSNSFVYTVNAGQAGFHTYQAVITPPPNADTLSQNNTAGAFSQVLGPPKVLVISTLPGGGTNIAAALHATGVSVTQLAAAQVVPSLTFLQQFAATVIVDTPADILGPDLLSLLPTYVRDLGHGLAVIGGPNSYALGNYGGTPLEDVLPVKMDVPQRKDTPSVAVVLIIESLESDYTVNISKEAGKGVVNLLTPRDQVAVSDASTGFAVPLRYVTDKAAINATIDAMQPGDPGSYTPYLQDALTTLQHAKAAVKHIILLGDGDAEDNYYPIIHKIVQSGISVSTIATGISGLADFSTMQDIAKWGHGRYYLANDVTSIPQIFLKEARTVKRSGLILEHFAPAPAEQSPLLDGLTSLPYLDGYVATTPKPTGQLVLISNKADPILAQWQTGQGRTVAWTSDSHGLWSSDLLRWPQATRLWSNIVSWILPPPDSGNLAISTSSSGGMGHIAIDVGGPLANNRTTVGQNTKLTVHIANPDGSAQSPPVEATAPNHYEGTFDAAHQGAYLLNVEASAGTGKPDASAAGGLVVPYSPEYLTATANQTFLAELALAGGGKALSANPATAAAAAFADNLAPVTAPLPLTSLLLLLAALLLPIDVAARRLVVNRSDLRLLLAAINVGGPARLASTGSAGPMGQAAQPSGIGLEKVRAQRARRQSITQGQNSTSQQPAPDITPLPPPVTLQHPAQFSQTSGATQRNETNEQAATQRPAQPSPSPTTDPQSVGQDDYAGRLLEAKRRRRR